MFPLCDLFILNNYYYDSNVFTCTVLLYIGTFKYIFLLYFIIYLFICWYFYHSSLSCCLLMFVRHKQYCCWQVILLPVLVHIMCRVRQHRFDTNHTCNTTLMSYQFDVSVACKRPYIFIWYLLPWLSFPLMFLTQLER